MIKVLEVNVDDNGYGGVYAFVLGILENIGKEFRIDLCSFEIFEKESNIDYIESFGGKTHYCGYTGNFFFKQIACLRNLYKLIKAEQYDVAHIHSDVSYKLLLYALMCKVAGISKILIHSHSTGVDGKYRKVKHFLHNIGMPLLPFAGHHFLACSQTAAEWMYPASITQSLSYTLINNGIDSQKFKYNPLVRAEMRKELGVETAFVIGHIGRFCYQKNHGFLIDIFYEIIKKKPSAILVLVGSYVGDSSYWDETKEKVKKLGLEKNVLFLRIREDVHRLMQVMDCFLLPSRFEGLGIVGIEAQAAGLQSFFSDNITQELGITHLGHFLSLQTSAAEWAEKILSDGSVYERKDMQQEIIAAGYDVKSAIRKLEGLYRGGNDIL